MIDLESSLMLKRDLNLVVTDAILAKEDLGVQDYQSLNHPKLRFLDREIRRAIEDTMFALCKIIPADINYSRLGRLEPTPEEMGDIFMAVSRVISENIENILHEEPNEYGSPHNEMEALLKYRNLIFEWFQETYALFQ